MPLPGFTDLIFDSQQVGMRSCKVDFLLRFRRADVARDVEVEISIVRLGFCMNNFLVLLTLRVRLTGLHS